MQIIILWMYLKNAQFLFHRGQVSLHLRLLIIDSFFGGGIVFSFILFPELTFILSHFLVVVNSGLYFKLEAYFKSLVSFPVHQHKSEAIKDWKFCVHVWDLLISRYHLKVIRWGPKCFVEDPNFQNLEVFYFGLVIFFRISILDS